MDIFGEVVKDLFETFGGVDLLFLQGVKDTHQGATRMGASIRSRAETDLAGDDGGTEVRSARLFSAGICRFCVQ